ncbi:MAG: tyrosine-type recombinase/integrase [Anaerolineae bacterium]
MPRAEQLPLFPQKGVKGDYGPPLGVSPPLSHRSSLQAAIGTFHDHMVREGFTDNTIRAFLSDLRLLSRYLGPGRLIGQIATEDLNNFLTYLLRYRGVPCSPKSYSRRVTTLKVFFGWLADSQVLPLDPAAPVVHQRVSSPLPKVLYESQVERVLETTHRLMTVERKADTRPHLLVTLILSTGIKKSECMSIALNHIDLSDPTNPVLYIRYANPRFRKKERKLQLPTEFPLLLEQYMEQYQPRERLFECTARNLEYVLHHVAQLAGLSDGLSFETLRMTCAVRDYQSGMPPENLRKKLGLSLQSWRETFEKIQQLAAPPL